MEQTYFKVIYAPNGSGIDDDGNGRSIGIKRIDPSMNKLTNNLRGKTYQNNIVLCICKF